MSRLEPVLVAFFLATWIVSLLAVLGLVDLRGSLELALYPLYSIAAAELACQRLRGARSRIPAPLRRASSWSTSSDRLEFSTCCAPWPRSSPARCTVVPFYSFGVWSVFFLVQVFLMPHPAPRRSLRAGERDTDRDGEPPVVP